MAKPSKVKPVVAYKVTYKCGHWGYIHEITLTRAMRFADFPCDDCIDEMADSEATTNDSTTTTDR